MIMRFIGSPSLLNGKPIRPGELYELEVVSSYKKRGFWVLIDGAVRCPYSSLESFMSNWRLP